MLFNPKDYKDKLLFVPLGGANEIGINVNLYHYQGKWIMVDCGSGFADDALPGVDMVVADLAFIESRKDDLLGLIVTHAHEDHLGAIQYSWSSLGCPIFTTRFTKNFLKARLAEYSFVQDVVINEIRPREKFDLGPFSIEMVGLTHSAPEMQALMIRTEAGNIMHTGDWKFDDDPVVGKVSDEEALKEFGDEGVLALVCDSTNVFNMGASGSEGEVRKSLVDIIAGCPKMVVVTTFASNLARLDTIIHAGQQAGRKIVLTGRSMHRMFAAAQESGYLTDVHAVIDEKNVSRYNKEELLIIATGCQGEPMAAISKIVSDNHPSIKLSSQDTVIFSSKIIPGNEKKIFRLFNLFVRRGIEVITERDHFVHVSGHPSVEELKRMYNLIRPQICIPVHGEPVHIHEHAKLAKRSGIKKVIEVENGSVALLDPKDYGVIGKVENGYLAVDGNYLLPDHSNIFKMRRRMRDSGIVVATVAVNKKGKLMARPSISMPGLLDMKEDYSFYDSIRKDVMTSLQNLSKSTRGGVSRDQVEATTKSALKKTLKNEINKSPIIMVNVVEVFE